MKNLHKFIVIAALLGLVLSLLLWHYGTVKTDTSSMERDQGRTAEGIDIAASPKPPSDRRAQSIFDALRMGQADIVFYGKVVDQNDRPVADASIEYQIVKPGNLLGSGAITQKTGTGSVSSDLNGNFEIRGSGETLSIAAVRKTGYRESRGHRHNFGFLGGTEAHTPDRDHPQVFTLLDREVDQKIGHSSIRLRLPWDGVPVLFDLESGQLSTSGNLAIKASRSGRNRTFDWDLSLSIRGGELQEVANGAGFIAPVDGYAPTWKCGYLADEKPWRFGRDSIVFYHLNGQYGRLDLRIYADAGPGDVSIHLERYVNTSGGRDTEGHQ